MGCLRPCYATGSGSTEYAIIECYDETAARTGPPGFDDLLGEPFLPDGDDDGVGERDRPGEEHRLKCKAAWTRGEEHTQTPAGNAPPSTLQLTLYEDDLIAAGLLVDGVLSLRANDRLLRLEYGDGTIRHDFTSGDRPGPFVYEVRPGETGTRLFYVLFETRRNAR